MITSKSKNKKDLDIVFAIQWKNEVDKTPQNIICLCDIPATTLKWEHFKDYLLKNCGGSADNICVFYTTCDGRETVINSQIDFQIALYTFRRKARFGELIHLTLERLSTDQNSKAQKKNDKKNKLSSLVDNDDDIFPEAMDSKSAPKWFTSYMAKFKEEMTNEIQGLVSGITETLKKDQTITTKSEGKNRYGKHGESSKEKDLSKYEQRKLEKLEAKSKKKQKEKISKQVKLLKKSPSDKTEVFGFISQLHLNAKSIAPNNDNPVHLTVGEKTYEHTWDIMNNGVLPWNEETELKLTWGSKLFSPAKESIKLPCLAANQVATISMKFNVPAVPGFYESYWHFHHKGARFGHWIGCSIIVTEPINGQNYLTTTSDVINLTQQEIVYEAPERKQKEASNNTEPISKADKFIQACVELAEVISPYEEEISEDSCSTFTYILEGRGSPPPSDDPLNCNHGIEELEINSKEVPEDENSKDSHDTDSISSDSSSIIKLEYESSPKSYSKSEEDNEITFHEECKEGYAYVTIHDEKIAVSKRFLRADYVATAEKAPPPEIKLENVLEKNENTDYGADADTTIKEDICTFVQVHLPNTKCDSDDEFVDVTSDGILEIDSESPQEKLPETSDSSEIDQLQHVNNIDHPTETIINNTSKPDVVGVNTLDHSDENPKSPEIDKCAKIEFDDTAKPIVENVTLLVGNTTKPATGNVLKPTDNITSNMEDNVSKFSQSTLDMGPKAYRLPRSTSRLNFTFGTRIPVPCAEAIRPQSRLFVFPKDCPGYEVILPYQPEDYGAIEEEEYDEYENEGYTQEGCDEDQGYSEDDHHTSTRTRMRRVLHRANRFRQPRMKSPFPRCPSRLENPIYPIIHNEDVYEHNYSYYNPLCQENFEYPQKETPLLQSKQGIADQSKDENPFSKPLKKEFPQQNSKCPKGMIVMPPRCDLPYGWPSKLEKSSQQPKQDMPSQSGRQGPQQAIPLQPPVQGMSYQLPQHGAPYQFSQQSYQPSQQAMPYQHSQGMAYQQQIWPYQSQKGMSYQQGMSYQSTQQAMPYQSTHQAMPYQSTHQAMPYQSTYQSTQQTMPYQSSQPTMYQPTQQGMSYQSSKQGIPFQMQNQANSYQQSWGNYYQPPPQYYSMTGNAAPVTGNPAPVPGNAAPMSCPPPYDAETEMKYLMQTQPALLIAKQKQPQPNQPQTKESQPDKPQPSQPQAKESKTNKPPHSQPNAKKSSASKPHPQKTQVNDSLTNNSQLNDTLLNNPLSNSSLPNNPSINSNTIQFTQQEFNNENDMFYDASATISQGAPSENSENAGAIHILPETLVNGAVNVASSAINTARSVINMFAQKNEPGRWVNGHWISSHPATSREANLRLLSEMGFWNRDLCATLLARYNDDLQKVITELLQ